MKKLLKRAFILALATLMSFSVVGCGGGAVADDENTLQIYIFEQGYGVEWVNQIAESFKSEEWVKEKYPNLNILKPTDNRTTEFGKNQLELGSKKNTYDILFTTQVGDYYNTPQLLDLTELVYEANVPGEDVKYKDKLNQSVLSSFIYTDVETGEESYYGVPWQGGLSLILYNKTKLDQLKMTAPNTTDELIAICEQYKQINIQKYKDEHNGAFDPEKNMGKIPGAILQSNDTQYCNVFHTTWWAQYDGVEGYENFYNGIDKRGERTNKIFSDYTGRLEALKVFEVLFDYKKYDYIDEASYNDTFMTSQTNFIKGTKGLFHFNGDWFSQEMQVTIKNLKDHNINVDDIRMLRTPIISSIVNLCDSIKGENGGTADQELSALITAIDNGSTALEGTGYNVSSADFKRIKDARYIVGNGVSNNVMGVIPAYSKSKDLAVDFVRYMATDKALAVYTKATLGSTLDFDFDIQEYDNTIYDNLPALNKEKINYYKSGDITILKSPSAFPLNVYGNLNPFENTRYYQTFAVSSGATSTAQDFWNKSIETWTPNKFLTALGNAGL